MPLPIILAGGAELALSGDGLVATIGGTDYTLRDSRDRRDFDLDGADVVGFRLTANGFALVLSEVDRRGNESFSELGFITNGAVAVADRRPANLDAFDLTLLESQYEQDLNGDEADGFARIAELVPSVDGSPSLHEVTTGAFGIGDGADTIAIVTDRGAPWSPPRGQEVIGVRKDGAVYNLLLVKEGSRGPTYSELEVDENGVAAGRATAVNEVDLLDKETAYGRDLDGDGEIGPVIAEEAVELTVNAAGDLSVHQQPSGLLGVSDADGADPIVPLVTSRGQPWAASQGEVIAVRANGPSVTVLTRGESGDFEYAFELVGGDHVQTGRPLSIDARELALREIAYDLDLNGDGVKGDAVTARLDSAVRNDGAELPLYKTAAGNYFFGPGDGTGAVCGDSGEAVSPTLAPSFPFTGEQPGTILRTSRDGLWDPNYEGANGEAVGIRATAVDGAGEPTAVAVLVRIESETGIVRYFEQPLTVDGASAQAGADTSRWTQLDVAEAEALYLTDFDGDGEIDIRDVDASAFQPPLTGLTLDGETVRMTGAQFAALSAGDGVSGAGKVEVSIDGVGAGETAIIDGTTVCAEIELDVTQVNAAPGVVVALTETAEKVFTVKGFSDIQPAIDDAVTTTGTDIYVGVGEYESPRMGYLNIDKSLNLYGAQSGVVGAADERSGGESVIRQSSDEASGWEFIWGTYPGDNLVAGTAASKVMVSVTADDVTIDGFTFTNFSREAINVRSLATEDSMLSGVSVTNNRIVMEGTQGGSFTDHTQGRQNQYNAIVFGEAASGADTSTAQTFSDITVSGNFIDINHLSNTYSGARGVIFTNQFADLTYDGVVIDNNTIDTFFDIFVSGAVDKTTFVNGEVTNNTLLGKRGLTGPNFDTVLIDGNTFESLVYGADLSAIGSTITNNSFASDLSFGLRLKDSTEDGGVASSGNTVSGNTIGYNNDPSAGSAGYVGGLELHDESAATLSENIFVDGGAGGGETFDVYIRQLGTDEVDTLDNQFDPFDGEVFAGGAGADMFRFAMDESNDIGVNLIEDFGNGLDKLQIAGFSQEQLSIAETDAGLVITAANGEFDGSVTLLGLTSGYYQDQTLVQTFEENDGLVEDATPFGFRTATTTPAYYGDLARTASDETQAANAGDWYGLLSGERTDFDNQNQNVNDEFKKLSVGPRTFFDGTSTEFGGGFEMRASVYIDPETFGTLNFLEMDATVLRGDGSFLRGFTFHVSGKDTGVFVYGDNNAYFNNYAPPESVSVTEADWFEFVWTFGENELGDLSVDMEMFNSAGDSVYETTRTDVSDDIASVVGGHRALTFYTNNEDLPVDDISLTRFAVDEDFIMYDPKLAAIYASYDV